MWLRDETSQGVEGGSSSSQVVDILYHIFIWYIIQSHIYIYIHMYIYMCVCAYVYAYVYIYIYTYAYGMYMHVCVFIYIHTRICAIVKVGFYIPISVVGHSSRIHNGGMTMTEGRWPVQNHGCPKWYDMLHIHTYIYIYTYALHKICNASYIVTKYHIITVQIPLKCNWIPYCSFAASCCFKVASSAYPSFSIS